MCKIAGVRAVPPIPFLREVAYSDVMKKGKINVECQSVVQGNVMQFFFTFAKLKFVFLIQENTR
jgi:hypothetical protein